MNREIPELPAGLPPRLDHMLRRCFAFNPSDRPSFSKMYDVFRADWGAAAAPSSASLSLSPPPADSAEFLRPISGLFDVLRAGGPFYYFVRSKYCS